MPDNYIEEQSYNTTKTRLRRLNRWTKIFGTGLILVASASQNASAIPLGRIVERPPPAIFFIMLQMILVGETTVEAESAPVREDYPDGRILYVLHTGDVVTVSELQGFGQGFWFRVKLANNNNNNNEASSEGWLDVRLTSYFEDMRSGRLHQ